MTLDLLFKFKRNFYVKLVWFICIIFILVQLCQYNRVPSIKSYLLNYTSSRDNRRKIRWLISWQNLEKNSTYRHKHCYIQNLILEKIRILNVRDSNPFFFLLTDVGNFHLVPILFTEFNKLTKSPKLYVFFIILIYLFRL